MHRILNWNFFDVCNPIKILVFLEMFILDKKQIRFVHSVNKASTLNNEGYFEKRNLSLPDFQLEELHLERDWGGTES